VWYTLVFDVVRDDRHGGIAHRVGVVALCPEVTAPELGFHLGMFCKNVFRGDAFDLLHYI
jgi:hypothetical protein